MNIESAAIGYIAGSKSCHKENKLKHKGNGDRVDDALIYHLLTTVFLGSILLIFVGDYMYEFFNLEYILGEIPLANRPMDVLAFGIKKELLKTLFPFLFVHLIYAIIYVIVRRVNEFE